MTTKHTPTPWKHVGCYVLDGDGKRVLEVCGNYNYFTDTVNAERIVKCVNMHDELVEALRPFAVEVLSNYDDDQYPDVCNPNARAYRNAVKTLKKAGAL